MKLPDKETILNELVLDSDLGKMAAASSLWDISEEDPMPQMPIFEGTVQECVREAKRIAEENGYRWVSDNTVFGGHWSNANGDSLMIDYDLLYRTDANSPSNTVPPHQSELVPDSDLGKTADNYQPDPTEDAAPQGRDRFSLWIYEAGEDDTGLKSLDSLGQMPEFEGTWGEVNRRAQEIAQEHGFWLVNDDTVMGGHWQNANGDVMQIE